MPLRFTGTRIRFLDSKRHVVVTAEQDGVPVSVVILSAVIEHLAAKQRLSKDASFSAVVQHKSHLEEAADRAYRRHGSGDSIITVGLTDMDVTATPAAV